MPPILSILYCPVFVPWTPQQVVGWIASTYCKCEWYDRTSPSEPETWKKDQNIIPKSFSVHQQDHRKNIIVHSGTCQLTNETKSIYIISYIEYYTVYIYRSDIFMLHPHNFKPAPSHQCQELARMTKELSELKKAQRRAKAESQAGAAPVFFFLRPLFSSEKEHQKAGEWIEKFCRREKCPKCSAELLEMVMGKGLYHLVAADISR